MGGLVTSQTPSAFLFSGTGLAEAELPYRIEQNDAMYGDGSGEAIP